jgi:hypothetical protein
MDSSEEAKLLINNQKRDLLIMMSSENRAGVANNAIHLSRHRRFLSLSVTQCGQVMASVRQHCSGVRGAG